MPINIQNRMRASTRGVPRWCARFATHVSAVAALLVLVAATPSQALERPTRKNIWDIEIGTHVRDLVDSEYQEYACGSNGGPPGALIDGWSDFAACAPGEDGFHEVYFRYDDELEYYAKAQNDSQLLRIYEGTQVVGFHSIVSALIDTGGRVAGVRIVTDPRVEYAERRKAWNMRRFIRARFDDEGWTCVDLPPVDGELPVGTRFIKQTCEKISETGLRIVLQAHLRRKAGQAPINPRTGARTFGEYESFTRVDLLLEPPS